MKYWFLSFSILFSSLLTANCPSLEDVSAKNVNASKSTEVICTSWKPYFLQNKAFQLKQNAFFQTNIGVGFLYFDVVNGNLSGQPAIEFQPWNYTPMRGKLTYNRTPLYEYLLGYKLTHWFKLALSYQYQGGIVVQSKFEPSMNPIAAGITTGGVYSQFRSNLILNGLMAKFYFQLPSSLIWRGLSYDPYVAVGVGSGWQSWTRPQVNRNYISSVAAVYLGEDQYLRQKISANVIWTVDAGLQIQKQNPTIPLSVTVGCKYNSWGQARSIGKMSQQDSFKGALIHPVRVKNVYSFAPYLGAQWNFPTIYVSKSPFQIDGKCPNTFKPFFVSLTKVEAKKSAFVLFNAGPSFFYFSKVRGNLFGRPDTNFGIWGTVPLKGLLRYNRVPLLECLWGYQFNHWIKGAISFQNLSGMTVQTRMLNAFTLNGSTGTVDYSQFQANLGISSIMGKVYFELPRAMIFKGLATTPYLSAAVGPAWQSWTRIQINRTDNDTVGYNSDLQPIRQKVMANAAFLIDAGFRMQNVYPGNDFSFTLGCKYNQWGQARNIGKLTQQGGMIKGLNHPFRIKVVYSFTPYLGAQWNFPATYVSKKPYAINGRSVTRFKPFWTSIANLQEKKGPWVQFNVGLGFLYFNQIRGNLAGEPRAVFVLYGDVPLKEHMIYNRTPVFEYMLGYRFNNWAKLALSYQHQGGVTFQTQILDAMAPPIIAANVAGHYSQFQANLALDSIMVKGVFELPYSMVMKGTATSPYLGVGVGPGWQTWSRVQINRMYDATTYIGEPQHLRQKISANFVFMIDAGLRIQSAFPEGPFSALIGCKYNQWGQARNIGTTSDQDGIREGLWDPIKIKTLYSFVPYLGMQWNF